MRSWRIAKTIGSQTLKVSTVEETEISTTRIVTHLVPEWLHVRSPKIINLISNSADKCNQKYIWASGSFTCVSLGGFTLIDLCCHTLTRLEVQRLSKSYLLSQIHSAVMRVSSLRSSCFPHSWIITLLCNSEIVTFGPAKDGRINIKYGISRSGDIFTVTLKSRTKQIQKKKEWMSQNTQHQTK